MNENCMKDRKFETDGLVAEKDSGPDPKRVIGLWRYRVALVVPSSEAAKAGRLQAHD